MSLSVALTAGDSDEGTGPGEQPADLEPLRVIEASGDLTGALTEFRAGLGESANGSSSPTVGTEDFLLGEPQVRVN